MVSRGSPDLCGVATLGLGIAKKVIQSGGDVVKVVRWHGGSETLCLCYVCVCLHAKDRRQRFLARFSFPLPWRVRGRAGWRPRRPGPRDKRLKSTLICSPFPRLGVARARPLHLSKYQSISWNRGRLCPGTAVGGRDHRAYRVD